MIPHVQLVAVQACTEMTPTTRAVRTSVFIIRHTIADEPLLLQADFLFATDTTRTCLRCLFKPSTGSVQPCYRVISPRNVALSPSEAGIHARSREISRPYGTSRFVLTGVHTLVGQAARTTEFCAMTRDACESAVVEVTAWICDVESRLLGKLCTSAL